MNKIALITGVTGQDGAYLSEFLLKKDIQSMASNAEPPSSIPIESIICIRIRMSIIKILFCIMAT